MNKYRNGGPTGKKIPGALYPGDRGYVPPPGNVGWRDPNIYRHANDRFYTTDQEYIDLRFMPGPGEPVNRPVVKMPPGSPAARSTTTVRFDGERGNYKNGGTIMNDNLKKMYASGGMLKALLQDPAQRAMAAKMLASNTDSVVDGNAGRGGTKKYSVGGKMYANGGGVDPEPESPLGFDPRSLSTRQTGVVPSDEEIYAALEQTVGQSLTQSGMSPQEYIAAGYLGSDWQNVAARARGMANKNFSAKEAEMMARLQKQGIPAEARQHPRGIQGYVEEQVAMSYPEGSVMYHQYQPNHESEMWNWDRAGVGYDRSIIDRLNAMQPAENAITDEQIGKYFNQNATRFPRDPKPVGFMGR